MPARLHAEAAGRASEARRDLLAYLSWLFVHAPSWVSRLHVEALALALRGLRPLPPNPVRRSCEAVARIAPRHDARALYRGFAGQVRLAALGYLEVLREGPPAVERRVTIPESSRRRVRALLEEGRGVLIAVPHNVGGILASVEFGRLFPARVLLRNSTSPRRDRTMVEFFERLGVDAALTRSAGPGRLFRESVRALGQGRVLVATLDNIDPGRRSRVEVEIFGCRVPFAAWGARIAAHSGAPVVPAWVTRDGERFRLDLGQPAAGADAAETIGHYASYFERRALEDPSSWLFLGHKRWTRVLCEAAARTSDAGRARTGPHAPAGGL